MLSQLQLDKLKRFFHILDFDRNGVIEEDDFTGIAENLCILWGLDDDSAEYAKITNRFSELWNKFNFYVNNNEEQANWEHFLEFGDKFIVNSDPKVYNSYVEEFVGEIFDNFDSNGDGFISLEEFVDLFVAYRIEVRYSARAFRSIDNNDDDKISREELIDAVKDFFTSTDENAPGNFLFGAF